MKLTIRHATVGIAALSLALSGCGLDQHPAYGPNVKYGVRKDPILQRGNAKNLGEERYDPDRPGVLPIMRLTDVYQADHPYNAGSRVILASAIKRILKDEGSIEPDAFDKLTAPERRSREDRILKNPTKHQLALAEAMDKTLRDPTQMSQADRDELETQLVAAFGTPASPKVSVAGVGGSEDDLKQAVTDLKLDDATLAMGSKHYRIHCLHCHGVPGDGRGPTARWINPHPRDFRAGIFKFQSVDQSSRTGRPPSRDDLMRTLRQGIEGTAMPTFGLLKDDDLEAIVSYVIHLSIRGKTELTVISECFEYTRKDKEDPVFKRKAGEEGDLKANVKAYALQWAAGWVDSNKTSSAIKVKEMPDFNPDDLDALAESVERGRQIFTANASDKLIDSLRDRLLLKEMKGAQKAALDKAIAAAETKAVEAAAKTIEAAKAKAVKEEQDKVKKKLTEEEVFNLHEKVEKQETDKIKETIKKDYGKFEKEIAQALPKIEQELKATLRDKAKNTLNAPKCVTCHIDYGRQAKFKFDEWGTLVRPNNLPQGMLRGGKRPVDIYYRIHSGIPGSEMTPFGSVFEGNEQYLWDLVNFVTVVPYPAMRDRLKLKID